MPTKRKNLTLSDVKALQPKEKEYTVWDGAVTGFGVKVTPLGKKVAILMFRFEGRNRKLTIGSLAQMTLHQARTRASEALYQKANGTDPAAEKINARRRHEGNSVNDHFKRYEAEVLSKLRTGKVRARIFRKDILPNLGARTVTDLKRADVRDVLRRVQDRGANITANRTHSALSAFFSWLINDGVIEQSPMAGLRAPSKEKSRDRHLNDIELRRVIQAARQTPFPFGPIVLLLILTGQRREEVSGMRWNELDFDARTWTIPRERAKNEKTHTVHLTSLAIGIIKACPQTGSHVLSLSQDKPFSGWSKSKHRLDEKCGVANWTLHDLRRTMVTIMKCNGVSETVADRILNHVTGSVSIVAKVYQRYEYIDERREALELWSKHVETLEHA